MRPLHASLIVLALTGCGPDSGATESSEAGTSGEAPATGSTSDAPTTSATSTDAVTTTDAATTTDAVTTTDAATTTEDSDTSTGEPVTPGCDDGVPAAGELCFEQHTLAFESWPSISALTLTDLDADGHLDIVATSVFPCPLTTPGQLRSHGPPKWASKPDVSRDGGSLFELVTAFGDGQGGFTQGKSMPVQYSSGRGLLTGDMNGDGHTDVAMLTGEDMLVLHTGNGDGTLAAALETSLPGLFYDLAAGDIDGDGDLDLVAVNESVLVLQNDGAGHFTGQPFAVDGGLFRTRVFLRDLDDDGDLDVLVGRNNPAKGAIEVLLGDGAGAFEGAQQVALAGTIGDITILPDAIDGRPAVIVGGWNKEGTTLEHLVIGPDGLLATPQPMTPTADLSNLLTGRFDGDERADVMQAGFSGLAALLGGETWPTAPVEAFTLDLTSWSSVAVAGDVNEDGLDDVLVVESPVHLLLSNP